MRAFLRDVVAVRPGRVTRGLVGCLGILAVFVLTPAPATAQRGAGPPAAGGPPPRCAFTGATRYGRGPMADGTRTDSSALPARSSARRAAARLLPSAICDLPFLIGSPFMTCYLASGNANVMTFENDVSAMY